jgi:F-type H+-transporting ATPase subunit delta
VRSQEIARRYATALYQVSVEDATVEATERELNELARETVGDPAVRGFLGHPLVPREAKTAFLEQAFPDTSERVKGLLKVLIRNRRATYLDLIHDEFAELRIAAEGKIHVTAVTAQALSNDDKARLTARLEAALHRPVELEETIDPSLIGGLRIEADGHVLDGSLRARLAGLRKQLEE